MQTFFPSISNQRTPRDKNDFLAPIYFNDFHSRHNNSKLFKFLNLILKIYGWIKHKNTETDAEKCLITLKHKTVLYGILLF